MFSPITEPRGSLLFYKGLPLIYKINTFILPYTRKIDCVWVGNKTWIVSVRFIFNCFCTCQVYLIQYYSLAHNLKKFIPKIWTAEVLLIATNFFQNIMIYALGFSYKSTSDVEFSGTISLEYIPRIDIPAWIKLM